MRSRHRQTNAAGRPKRCQPVQMGRRSRAKPQSSFPRFNPSPEAIRLVMLIYERFSLSLRNADDFLFERGIDLCQETLCFWRNRFGLMWAGRIRRPHSPAAGGRKFRYWRWQPGEICVKIKETTYFAWRAVNHEGEVLESYVTKTGNKAAALVSRRNRWSRQGGPEAVTTDGLRLQCAALTVFGNAAKQGVGRGANNRVENSYLPIRRRKLTMIRF